ncbi:MAG: phospho-sugar mutase [Corynebacteriales bacterium]|nr:phospho-sugar mutase [Mycobacteriales bacterium]
MITPELAAQVRHWIAHDPDAGDRAELSALLDQDDESALADRFSGPLEFGTAGLRGPLRAGPNGMNRAVVRNTAAGLVAYLAEQKVPGPLVIGYDARHRSHEFAVETARVAVAAGRAAVILPRPLPTPVLAYAIRAIGASAGVMVTASHNPPGDNGYKVYLADGAQIAPPTDALIAAHIAALGHPNEIPVADVDSAGFSTLPERCVQNYVDQIAALVEVKATPKPRIAYTPLHGVGAETVTRVFTTAGFDAPHIVPKQAEPDPDFPTVNFPNPEEPGALDLLIEHANAIHADLAIANDPDADRCAVVVPLTQPGTWRALTGDELGTLLADHLMTKDVRGTFVTTIVSSSMLRSLCVARDRPYVETLTGFKWIMRALDDAGPIGAGTDIVYGYEEALGYAVAPHLVRDKDGISAALLVSELAQELRARNLTLLDRLEQLNDELGAHHTSQVSIRARTSAELGALMRRLRAEPPAELAGENVSCEDLAPRTDALIFRGKTIRVVIRPSGTEPKLKAYLEVTGGSANLLAELSQQVTDLLNE